MHRVRTFVRGLLRERVLTAIAARAAASRVHAIDADADGFGIDADGCPQTDHTGAATMIRRALVLLGSLGAARATTTNWGAGVGWCYSSLDHEIGKATGQACWDLCAATYT